MKVAVLKSVWLLFAFCVLCASGAGRSRALEGDIRMHDPSTVVQCDGRYWVFSTGRGIGAASSEDGWTWRREAPLLSEIPADVASAVPKHTGNGVWAPDVQFLNGQYYVYYAISFWGSNVSAIGLITSPTLSPSDPKYHWTNRGLVVHSVEGEKLNAIDPCVMRAPNGTLWLTYGSYIGVVQMVELNAKTGLRIAPNSPVYRLSSASEASALISHGGYFYLFVNRNSCCKGKDSAYNIRVGRSRKVTGPYLDKYGVDMLRGGGSLFLASAGGQIGPGHFGLLKEGSTERFSCHYEFDADHGGRPVLDIKPLLWSADGWPVAGQRPADETYQIESRRFGTVLQTATAAGGVDSLPVRSGPYVTTANQKWTLTTMAQGDYKITVGTGNLELQAGAPLVAAPPQDTDSQLWKVEQVGDGSYRILCKSNNSALTMTENAQAGGRDLELAPYRGDDTQKWFLLPP